MIIGRLFVALYSWHTFSAKYFVNEYVFPYGLINLKEYFCNIYSLIWILFYFSVKKSKVSSSISSPNFMKSLQLWFPS